MKKYGNTIGLVLAILVTYILFSAITGNWGIFFDGLFSSFDAPLFIEKLFTQMAIILLISSSMLVLRKVGIFDVAAPGKFLLALLCVYFASYITPTNTGKIIVGCVVGLLVMIIQSSGILFLKVKFKVNEVAFGLMFNFLALFIYKATMSVNSNNVGWMDNLGNLSQMGQLTNFSSLGEGEMTIFIIPAVIIPILIWFFFKYTSIGLKTTIVGEGIKLANTMGINIKKKYFFSMIISSVIMSLALLAQLFSYESGQLSKEINSTPSIVWTGIVISLIIVINPISSYIYSFIFAMVYCSTTYMQSMANIDPQSIEMVTGLLMMTIAVIPHFIKFLDKKIGANITSFEAKVKTSLCKGFKKIKIRRKNGNI